VRAIEIEHGPERLKNSNTRHRHRTVGGPEVDADSSQGSMILETESERSGLAVINEQTVFQSVTANEGLYALHGEMRFRDRHVIEVQTEVGMDQEQVNIV
jgi:hypothetical protein